MLVAKKNIALTVIHTLCHAVKTIDHGMDHGHDLLSFGMELLHSH